MNILYLKVFSERKQQPIAINAEDLTTIFTHYKKRVNKKKKKKNARFAMINPAAFSCSNTRTRHEICSKLALKTAE